MRVPRIKKIIFNIVQELGLSLKILQILIVSLVIEYEDFGNYDIKVNLYGKKFDYIEILF